MAATRRRPRSRARRPPPRPGGTSSDLLARVVVAVPAIAFAVGIVAAGGWIFAGGIGLLGLICLHELFVMLDRARPVRLAAFLAVLGLVAAGTSGHERQVLLALVASVPLTFALALAMPDRHRVTASMAATLLGIVWIGLGVAHAALLRGLHHGGALVFLVLLGTFVGDTGAYLGGRLVGTRPLAPAISPNKTVEGLAVGVVVGTLTLWYASRTYSGHWISGVDGLLLGLAVALSAPVGDLFESLIKRDMGTKDTGGLFGAHGGALDRLDAVLFSLVAGYYVWLALA